MKAKNYLSNMYRLDEKINVKMEQVIRLRSLACSFTSTLQENKVQSGGYSKSILEESIIKIITAEKELNEEIDKLIEVKKITSQIIDLIADKDEQLLLELRYLCFKKWDQIALKMHISKATVFRLHKKALVSFDEVLTSRRSSSMNKYLSIYTVAELATATAIKLNMKGLPPYDVLIQLISKRNGLPVVFSDGVIRIWVDKLYIAYSYEQEQEVNYVYVTDRHIREETVSYINARLYRHKRINLPLDIKNQFDNASSLMRIHKKNYIISET